MKPTTIALALFFTACALTITVWLTRSPGQASIPVVIPPEPPADPGPAISPTGPYPKAVTPELDYDFGAAQHMSEGTHTFVIRNEGEAPLVVVAREGDSSCQCTLGKVDGNEPIPPGGEQTVTLKWTIKADVPMFRQWAKIRTNDPERKEIELTIHGRVEKLLAVVPAEVWEIGEIRADEGATATGAIYSGLLDKFEIESATCTNPAVSVTWEPVSAEKLAEKNSKSAFELKVHVKPDVPIGPFNEQVNVTIAGDHKLNFRVKGVRPGPIDVVGLGWHPDSSRLVLGEFAADKGKNARLFLYVRGFDGDLEIKSVKADMSPAKFTLARDEKFEGATKRYELKIEIPPGPPAARQRSKADKISFELNHPDAAEFLLFLDYLAL